MSVYPFFSVVIPTYNRAKFIVRTLESVFAQTYQHYEVIVVDNRSTDETEEVLRPHVAAGRVNFIRHDRNYERARSRNTGMGAARGDFVTLLDSDDLMYPTNLGDAAEFARANPGLKCFHNLAEIVAPDGRVVYRLPYPPLKDQAKAIAGGNFMACIGDFIHRDVYRHYRFDTRPELTGWEDWEFWLRVLAEHPAGRIGKVNSGIVQHGGRSVNVQDLSSLEAGAVYLAGKMRTDPQLRRGYGPLAGRVEATAWVYMAVQANSGGLHRRALAYLRRGFAGVLQGALLGLVKAGALGEDRRPDSSEAAAGGS
jgi:glycosyltransferase involved in cell wall biosynthesis